MKAATVEQEQMKWPGWKTVKRWEADRTKREKDIASALRALLDRVGEKKWLLECHREMGWGRTATYLHLNPASLNAKREHDRASQAAQRPRVVDIDTEIDEKEQEQLRLELQDKELDRAEWELAKKLIGIGFKRLAMEMHPDKGGTSEGMIMLKNVHVKLTLLIEGIAP